jgi:hypothetical protein
MYEHLCKAWLILQFYFKKMLFLESEFQPTLTQNYGRLPHIILMFLNQVYDNAHSVKK